MRIEATARSLILATPTVDIGYNFEKLNKARQNVDFVICDARYGDELLQRIGRAGRVLGKDEIAIPSRAYAILPPDAARTLAAYDGQTLTRSEFAQIVAGCQYLPPKHTLTGYIRTHAITECFWPIFQLGKMMPADLQDEMQALFDRVRDIFAPGSRREMWRVESFFRKYEGRMRWLQESKRNPIRYDRYTAQHVADWLEWLEPRQGRPEASALQPHLSHLLADQDRTRCLAPVRV